MHVAMEDHRSSDFPKLTLPLYERLKKIFKTKDGQVVIFPSSGTGAWEAALTNTLAPGDKVLAARFGQFSHLWSELAKRHGLEVIVQDEEWGTGANPDRIEEALRADKGHEIKGVMVVHNETATGVTSNVAAVRRAIDAAKHPALLYVDGVCSIASIDFRMDEWGVDLAITGSQKGLMLPAGLGIVVRQPEGARGDEGRQVPQGLFRFRRPDQGQPDRLFPLHAGADAALRLARVACHPRGGGARERLSPAIIISPAARAPRSRPGVSSSAPRSRNGIPTRSPRSWCRKASMAPM